MYADIHLNSFNWREKNEDDSCSVCTDDSATESTQEDNRSSSSNPNKKSHKIEIAWRSAIMILIIHLWAVYGGILFLTGSIKLSTFVIGKCNFMDPL
jgi:cytoskeletal protein RodZ